MSTNIHVVGLRDVRVIKTGKIVEQRTWFQCLQTPAKVTEEIALASDPLEAYKAWVLDTSQDIVEPIYAEDDILGEDAPIGTRVLNQGKYHLEKFKRWVEVAEAEGYSVSVESW